MADKSKTIIVRKIKKGHGGHHGGSWKVAYADFMTAMMAFFLLMWLISMVDPVKRAAVADYFRNYNVFKESGTSFMDRSSGIQQEVKATTREPVSDYVLKEMEKKINTSVELKLKGLKNQVLIDKVEGGIRIQIVDLEGKPMFKTGSAVPTDRCRQILNVVSETFKGLNIRIAVEGHTDSTGSSKERETNWDLSAQRASTARKILESDGIDQNAIAKVTGYADKDLLFKETPADPRNRRISLILMPEPGKKEEEPKADSKTEPQTLPIIPPPVAPPQSQETTAPVIEQKEPEPTRKSDKKKIIDPGIKPHKPIDIRPTLFPNLNE
jgi:chemotaxis protein MotB